MNPADELVAIVDANNIVTGAVTRREMTEPTSASPNRNGKSFAR